jgi:hypothetical protein
LTIENGYLLLHLATTGVMIGIIWFVQVVHYPMFARAGADGFVGYAADHARRTGWVVGPPMLLEALTGLLLLRWRPAVVPAEAVWLGLVLLAGVWASTLLLQVPCHGRLARGWDVAAHRRLVLTNWIRTVLWTVRGILVLWMLSRVL